MRILITNDDGIEAPGIIKLAENAKKFGEVTVIAPATQSSAMSHHISLGLELDYRKFDFPVEGVEAYALAGTPADCIRAAFLGIVSKDKLPDVVFSGINNGSNCGYDIQYSATVGAAMEALLYEVPVICFSQACWEATLDHKNEFDPETDFMKVDKTVYTDVCDANIESITRELLAKKLPRGQAWNVNFPNCVPDLYKGILYDRFPSQRAFWDDIYTVITRPDGSRYVGMESYKIKPAEEGSDIRAIQDGYISIGIIKNKVMTNGEDY
ncbi:MAG: 5'/3'-nucleotidase SurE [Lachnospiraceae bacterium]|nr:5'/3'-nucleotidase SurE [Lachnospiraceae bacterium]